VEEEEGLVEILQVIMEQQELQEQDQVEEKTLDIKVR
jgi:hypothetical protein